MVNKEKEPILPESSSIQYVRAINQSQRQNFENDTVVEQLQPRSFKEAIIRLLPRDNHDLLITIGLIAGIIQYWETKDTWLLVTFISFWTGKATERARQAYSRRRAST